MKKTERERKRCYRTTWRECHSKCSYPTWLEGELEYFQNIHKRVCILNKKQIGRFHACSQYIRDLEVALTVAERVAQAIGNAGDQRAMWSSLRWVRRVIRDAKDRFENGVEELE